MNLRIRHVLPTAPSPTRQILTFIFWRSIGIPRGGSSLAHVSGYKGVAHRLSIEIMAVPPGAKKRFGASLAGGPAAPPRAPESFLAHDVPHHHVERRRGALPDDVNRLLGDLRADGRDVAVVELVLDEPLDQRGLPDRDIPDEADLGLEVLLAGHRRCRHHAPPIERGLMYREDASIAPDNSYSSGSTFRAYRSFATRSARDWNAFSTLTPAFADVKWNGLSYARAAWTMSSSLIWIWSFRSILFPRNSIGILPVTL